MKNIILISLILMTLTLKSQEVKNNFSPKPSFIINSNVGLAYRTEIDPSGLDCQPSGYLDELKSGYSLDLSAYYGVPSIGIGFGLKYNLFKSTGSYGPTYIEAPNGEFGEGTITDELRIIFIGPSVCYLDDGRFKTGEVNLEFAIGYLEYSDGVEALGTYMIKGKSLGMISVIGYHFRITKNILIGPQFSFNYGVLTKMTVDKKGETGYHGYLNLGNDYKESLTRFDFSVGLKFKI